MNYIKATAALPKCDLTPDSLGVKVLIKPVIAGDASAFYGCRVSATPCFYRYGAPLAGVKSWATAPDLTPGKVWQENDGRFVGSLKRIVIDSSDANAVRIDDAMAAQLHLTVRSGQAGKVGIVRVMNKSGEVEPGARITWAKPERFDGRNGGYSPVT